jgi:hypothetical protein
VFIPKPFAQNKFHYIFFVLQSKNKRKLGPVALVMPITSNLQHPIYKVHEKKKKTV